MGKHEEIRPDKLVMWHTEQYNALPDDGCFVCLTDKEVYLLLQAVRQMTWETRWRVGEGDTLPDIDALASSLEVKLMTCDALQYRKSPTDHCVLEWSTDGGLTWSEAFDFSDCITSAVTPIVEQTGLNIINELLDKWDGTAESVTENLTYDGTGDDIFRDYALCNSLQLFVDTMAIAEIERRFKSIQIWEDVPEIMVALGAVLWITPIPGARVVAVGLAIAAAALEVGLPAWGALSLTDLEDEDARDAVACWMYEQLQGVTPTWSAFKACLDSTPFFFGSAEWNITLGVKPMIQELEVFIMFLQIWDSVYPLAAAGFLDDCTCPGTGWTVEFLGGAGRPPNWAIIDQSPFNNAVYNSPGDYWYAVDTPTESESSAYVTIEFNTAADFTVDWIMYYITLTNTDATNENGGQQYRLYDEFDTELAYFNDPGYHAGNTPAITGWEHTEAGVRKIRLTARIYEEDSGEDTECRMTKIVVHGSGTIPPEWAAYEI